MIGIPSSLNVYTVFLSSKEQLTVRLGGNEGHFMSFSHTRQFSHNFVTLSFILKIFSIIS